MTVVIALLALILLSALGASLVVVTNTELRAAANYAAGRESTYAADGALQIAANELLGFDDWNALLTGGALSSFVEGPPGGTRQLGDGTVVDLTAATNMANGEVRPWGANNPTWRLFAFGRLGPGMYVVAWLGDDPGENDGDPLVDGSDAGNPGAGILAIRAEAFGVRGTHTVLEATVRRHVEPDGRRVLQVLSWNDIKQ